MRHLHPSNAEQGCFKRGARFAARALRLDAYSYLPLFFFATVAALTSGSSTLNHC